MSRKALDGITDKVLAFDPTKPAQKGPLKIIAGASDKSPQPVKWWTTPITEIFDASGASLDAMHFDPAVASAIKELKQAEHETIRLSDLASVELRNQFVRIWAKDAEHGIPYLNATDLLSLLALGIPASGQRYLSYKTETNSKGLVVHEGWLLMTCSGTIGRVFYVPQRLDGWAATHDIIRIVPHDQGITGYLYAWLSTPVAQAQILSHIHGGQIDHITDEQVAGTLVPKLPAKQIREIHEKVMKALHAREQAIQTLVNAWPDK